MQSLSCWVGDIYSDAHIGGDAEGAGNSAPQTDFFLHRQATSRDSGGDDGVGRHRRAAVVGLWE